MKKLLFSVLILTLTLSFIISKEKLSFVTDDDFPPFGFVEDGVSKGIDYDIVKELAKRLDVEIEIKFVPWKRLLKMTEEGSCDGSFSLFDTEERRGFSIYADAVPVHYSTYSLFTAKGKEFSFDKVEDLYGRTIGMNAGFNISKEFDDAVKAGKIKIEEIEGSEKNIKKVLAGRTDAFVGNYHVTLYTAERLGMKNKISVLDNPVKAERGAFLVISKKSGIEKKEELVKKINQTMKEMKKDGTIDKLHNKYVK